MKRFNWTSEELEENISRVNDVLFSFREERERPGLDDKCLTSWNAMMLKGLCDAYAVFSDELFLVLANRNAKWIKAHQLREDGKLWRSYKAGTSSIEAFLEDYAQVIQSFIGLYSISFNEEWLFEAKKLTDTAIDLFGDEESQMFFFTESSTELIARKMEVNDNVIPSSNSVMARNLYYLSKYFHENTYMKRARQMLANVYDDMEHFGSGYSNWAMLLNHEVYGFYEFVCMSDVKESQLQEVRSARMQEVLIAKHNNSSKLPIFLGKETEDKGLIFVCVEGTCLMPTKNVTEAVDQVIQ
jgi:uncharacterized protein YyaL (SSP411 family)